MIGFDGIQVLDVTGPLEVFSRASRLLVDQGTVAAPAYEVELLAREPGPVRCSSGLVLVAERSWREVGAVDTLLVSGGVGTRAALQDEALRDWLVANAPRARRYGSVCTGTLLLGNAGLLDTRRATTHWAFVAELEQIAPMARVEPDALYLRDGALWTSAGVTAGMDMALAMVEEDWGRKLALEVARQLVMFLQRRGGLSQYSAYLAAQSASAEGQFRSLVAWMMERLDQDLGVPVLAARAGMSPRHFGRRFQEETGTTPAKFVERLRFEAARARLAEGDESLAEIARDCGFGSIETLRRVFRRRAGVGPAAYRMRMQRDALRAVDALAGDSL